MIKFSVVMAYFERKPQLRLTLECLVKSPLASSCEVIIVDDGSSKDHQLDQSFCHSFHPLTLRVFRLARDCSRTWINPCIPYNLGLSKVSGRSEWIIVQNPEVCYYSPTSKDLLTYLQSADPSFYHVLEVYALPKQMDGHYLRKAFDSKQSIPSIVKTSQRYKTSGQAHSMWYTRKPGGSPNFLHFCGAMHRSVLEQIGGFNPAMAQGVDYDDNEFLERVKRVAKPVFIPRPLVGFHQWHPKFNYKTPKSIQSAQRARNETLYHQTKGNPSLIKMDISQGLPKTVESVVDEPEVVDDESKMIDTVDDGTPIVDNRKVVMTITGIRPDFIRMAFVFKELDAHPAIRHVMVHTGQHYDELLSGSFFKDLGLRRPDHTLACGTSSKNHYEQLAYLSTAILEWLKETKLNPDLILFLGDSNSVTAALPLKKEGYVIGHIEAGMRSGDRRMLEEINRTVCDVCSDLFFVYHDDYKVHLLKEGVDETKRPIHVVGNTVVEPARQIMSLLKLFDRPKTQDFILMDIHRPENFLYKKRLQAIFDFGSWLASAYDVPISCLAYGRLRKCVDEWSIDLGQVVLTDLLPFPTYLTKVYDAKVLISDSGTGQEEPALLKTPVIVPRDFSERPQSYAGNCSIRLHAEVAKDLQLDEWTRVKEWVDAYLEGSLKISTEWLGDGTTSKQIISGIQEFLQDG